MRYPTIAGDRVVFVAEDDLWTVPLTGGIARRLTTALSDVTLPWLSPDGARIAFIAREDGPSEVYGIGADGGPPRQLTHLGASTATSGWSPDGRVAFVSDARSPFGGLREAYLVAADGGEPERLPWGPAQRVAFGPGGALVIGRNVGEPSRWKRYRGGTAGEFWVDADGSGEFSHWEAPRGNLASPMWLAGRIFFISDHEGIGNIYSSRPDGGDLRRHTDHADYYARNAQTDGHRIVYHAGGDLYVYDPATDRSQRLEVDLRSQRTQRARRFVEAARYLDGADLHPEGHSLLITTRGRAFSLGNWEGPVLPAGEAHGVRYRLARWLPDGQRLVVVADAGGEEALEVHRAPTVGIPTDRAEEPAMAGPPVQRLAMLDLGRAVDMAVAPVGNRLAVTNHRNEVIVVDLETDMATIVERNAFGGIAGLAWSPDGRWLCYSAPLSRKTSALRLWRASDDGGREEPVTITRPVLHDVSPAFDPEGRYLYFLSYRTFDPVYDSLQFDLGFPRGVRPYLITLQADAGSPFLPAPRPLVEEGGKRASEAREGRRADAPGNADGDVQSDGDGEGIRIDLEGIADRVVAFPLPEGRYRGLAAIRNKILFTVWPVEGTLGGGRTPGRSRDRGTLICYDLRELRQETIAGGVGDFRLALDTRTLLYRAGDRLRVLVAGKKPEKDDDEPGRGSGWVSLGRVRVAVDPGREWPQMLREAWRLQRDNFWTSDLSGVDWNLVWERYSRLLPRITTRGELSDLMWEMQGELGTSHAYEMGGDYRQGPGYGQGFLGADLAWDPAAGGYRVLRVVRGDGWSDGDDSPLRAPGVRVGEGHVIVAVDGRAVSEQEPVGAAMVGKGGAEVALTVAAEADGEGGRRVRTVVVKALTSERSARYRDWVESNRAFVHAETGGRIGYIHIPDMGPRGYAEFHRAWLTESQRDGLLVDVRHNGGGHVSQLILEKLARRPLGYDVPRWGQPEPYPAEAVAGPLVALCDELAGSDGDIFSHCFKRMKLGPLVGKRTWGGVVGIWVRHALVDGTHTSQPEFAFWFHDVGWGVENYGTDPDIPVENGPQDYAQGRDPQLRRALDEALAWLAESPPVPPSFGDRPSRALPTLPDR